MRRASADARPIAGGRQFTQDLGGEDHRGEIARRAGVSRLTVYNHFADLNVLSPLARPITWPSTRPDFAESSR